MSKLTKPSLVGQTYTLTFDSNTGTGAIPESRTLKVGEKTTLPIASTLSKTGAGLTHWSESSDGSDTNLTVGSSFTMPARNVTLYAKWTDDVYVVSFDGGNKTSGTLPDIMLVNDGDTATIPGVGSLEKVVDNESLSFVGWNTSDDKSGTFYSASDTITISGASVHLYASWKDITFVSPLGDDSTGKGTKSKPYKSIEKAITESLDYSEIRIANGTYNTTSTLNLKNAMDIKGSYDSNTWVQNLDGFQTEILSSQSVGILCDTKIKPFVVEGLKLVVDPSSSVNGIELEECPNATIRNNYIKVIYTSNGTTRGIVINATLNTSNATIESNIVYSEAGRYTYGIFISYLRDGSTLEINNNVIHAVKINSMNGAPTSIYINAGSGTKTLNVRNNTMVFGRHNPDTSSALGESDGSNASTLNVYFDNNIVFGATAVDGTYPTAGIYQGNNSTWNLVSLKNNNFFQLNSMLVSLKNSQDYTTIVDLENGVGAAATDNISVDMIAGGYFQDPNNMDYSLSATAPTSISEGGLKGDDLGWGFSKDILGQTRTGSLGTGWSMGAHEKD
ncbi:MAG: InlB B-repeat-containing protein [Bdellovibrionales bacterium]|nr:InlB B-repeat-containing protein [Bdellovibrionales bacterium]